MRWLISIPLLVALCGCADLGYYWHSASGHLAIMRDRVDISEMLADDTLDASLRERLLLVREIRDFSVNRLALPDNGSYHNYVRLDRSYLIRNLFAAPEFSIRLHQWCYPIIGCASYRGYYDETRLEEYAEELRTRGFEIYIGDVAAYSTLGWFDDPVLSSFIDWPEYRLAGLLFHELTHQRLYIDDDTRFNESLASAVQQVGTEIWLDSSGRKAQLDKLAAWKEYRAEVMALIESTRAQLDTIYRDETNDDRKRQLKLATFEEARERHEGIAARHGINGGYRRWFGEDLNNAKIGSVATYQSAVPAFVAMLQASRLDFEDFFNYVDRVGALKRAARDACLAAWAESPEAAAVRCPPHPGIPAIASS